MQSTKLSSKGQVIIPKQFRDALRWEVGMELLVIDTGEGLLLKPKAPFEPTRLDQVAGVLKDRVAPLTDAQIKDALKAGMRRKWRDRD
jgi:AbrB family looped-hinge helix DNA binding protein